MNSNTGRKKKKNFDIFNELTTPYLIQEFLNRIPYNPENITKSPLKVWEQKKANCFEGALFAAAGLKSIGFRPLIVDMIAENDDDHVIALFKNGQFYGAIAKSNTTVLRYREPVYRSLRELIMSYFDFYFNTLGEKTLRSYSNPVNLSRFDYCNWIGSEDDLGFIGDYLYKIKHHKLLNGRMLRSLAPADPILVELGFAGSVEKGLFKPAEKKRT
jgi:hypothetical protein